jgi:regulator of replication initiation timing
MMEGKNGGHTMIRISLALMKLKQDTLLELTEMEDGLKLLLSKDLWTDVGANKLIGLAGGEFKALVPDERLAGLDAEYQIKMAKAGEKKAGGDLQASVGRFFGKLKATASQLSVDTTNLVAPPMLRSLSRASFASSSSPQDGPEVERLQLSRVQTDGALMSRTTSSASARGASDNERALHGQIEELVRVLGEVQRRVGESERERDRLKLENQKLREMLAKVAEVMTPVQTPGGDPIDDLAIAQQQQDNSMSSLSDEISEILFSQSNLSSPSSSISHCSSGQSIDVELRTQLSETQHMLTQERQANALLQQQLSTTETELSRTRTALFDLRGKLAEASRREPSPSKERTAANERSPSSSGSLRELKLVVKTEQGAAEKMLSSKSTGGSIGSAGGSWGGWFGRN